MTESPKNIGISYKRVTLFYLIAISLSNVFRFDIFKIYKPQEVNSSYNYLFLTSILEGSGIFIGALLAIYLLKKERKTEMSFFGTSQSKAILMAAIPIIILTSIGIENKYQLNMHIYGLIAGLSSMLYCILEEYGWRGYLEDEFKGMKILFRVLLIGFLWYFWHLSFLTQASFYQNLFFLASLIFGSWGISKIAELTKSILASACFHFIVNIFMFNEAFRAENSDNKKLIVVLISIFIWIIVLIIWHKKNKNVTYI